MSWRSVYSFTAGSNTGAASPVAGLKASIIPEADDSSSDL